MLDTLLITVIMFTDTFNISGDNRFEREFTLADRDINIQSKIKQIVLDEARKQNRIYWLPLKFIVNKKED